MAQQADTHSASGRHLTFRDVLAIAVPITLSNATVPLIGFVDATVIGQLGRPHLLGAVALSATIFNFLYFVFNFLRMGTTGLAAQAAGANDGDEVAATLVRSSLLAAVIGLLLIVLHQPIIELALAVMGATERVAAAARTYFEIRIWAAPAALANFVLLGWFIGLGRADIAFVQQLILNGLNIAFAIVFVLVFNWSVSGVALAALLAEVIAAGVGAIFAMRELGKRGADLNLTVVKRLSELRRLFGLSRDILIRTACVQIVIVFFVSQGARDGDVTLATNHVLFNMVMITVYMIDGFAYAAETLVGQAIGARRRERYRTAVRLSMLGGVAVSLAIAVLFWFAGNALVAFVTTSEEVQRTARVYLAWAALMPITSVWCFILDGIFIGATATATMRNMMVLALGAFFIVWWSIGTNLENHGLWFALHVFFLVRAVTLAFALPGLERRLFSESGQQTAN